MTTGLLLTKIPFSNSSLGKGILVTGTTASGGTVVHTAQSATDINKNDEVIIYGQNLATNVRTVNIYLGAITDNAKTIHALGDKEYTCLIPGQPLNGGVVIKATVTVANSVALHGYVLRRY